MTRKPPLFGFKINMAVSVGKGAISNFTVCPANEHESRHIEELLTKGMKEVYADKGFSSKWKAIVNRGLKDRIQVKAVRGQPLGSLEIK